MGAKRTDGCHLDRLQAAIVRARRVKWLPLYSEAKAEVVATAVAPMGLHGGLSSRLPVRKTMALRAASTAAIESSLRT